MSISSSELYDFAFRGLLVEEALDRAGRPHAHVSGLLDGELAGRLSIAQLDDDLVAAAKRMATVYTAVAAFENTVRELLKRTLIDAEGDEWWEKTVSSDIRKRAEKRLEDEEAHRFHSQRGDDPINYTDLKDLINVIKNNWSHFEPFLQSQDWAKGVLDQIERSRNVIMHSGTLDGADIERLGMNIRDWIKQVGA
jgi:Arc/MetJ family transcription regulator